jgi:hypothetical protein
MKLEIGEKILLGQAVSHGMTKKNGSNLGRPRVGRTISDRGLQANWDPLFLKITFNLA